MRTESAKGDETMDNDTLESYKEMVSLAGVGLDEYLAVVAELQDASVLSGHISYETAENAEKWAEDITRFVTEKMDAEGVVPHYYIAALLDVLYRLGFSYFSEGFTGAVKMKFREDNV